MLKILYVYIYKLFISYFLINIIVLFFLFIIEFFWSKLNEIMISGINIYIIIKLLFYFGISLLPLIFPVAILLTSIMIYGIFSESYQLIAAKSLGISLWRIMNPLFILIIIFSIIIYLFFDYIIPYSQKKIKNITYNIATIKYGINIPLGKFIEYIPDIIIKIDKKIDKNYFQGIFIKLFNHSLNNTKTILAKKAILIPYKSNFYYLQLFNGTIYQENKKKNYYKIIKFDNLIQILKIPIFIDNKENLISTLNTRQIIKIINKIEINKKKYYINNYYCLIEKNNKFYIKKRKNIFIKKKYIYNMTKIELKKYFHNFFIKKNKIIEEKKYLLKIKLELQKRISFTITSIIMFFIGAPIGVIIKKGNIGLPVIITLIIFVLYYILISINIYLAEKNIINIIIGAWGANIIMCPLALYLTYKTNNDYLLK